MMIQIKLLFRMLVIFVAISMSTIVYAKGFSNYYGDHEESDCPFIGAVYAMLNSFTANTVVGYGRSEDGKLLKLVSFVRVVKAQLLMQEKDWVRSFQPIQ